MMFTADKIDDDGVWLGDITASENTQALDHHQISHILTILDYQPTHVDQHRTYLYILADDFQSTDLLTNEFEKCFQFINRATEQSHQVLIHCQKGISRSATIAAMYLMRKYSLTREQAIERLIEKRRHWIVMPNDGFLRQLDLYYQMNYRVDLDNELYKDFQSKRFHVHESNTSTDPNASIISVNNENERNYHCRTCHSKIFITNDIQRHEQPSNILCDDQSQVFTYFLDWIEEVFSNPIGTIHCPNCQTILGQYSLKGIRCPCHQWIKPAFVFQCQSIE